MTDRTTGRTITNEHSKSGPAVAVFIAAAIPVLLVVHWLASLD